MEDCVKLCGLLKNPELYTKIPYNFYGQSAQYRASIVRGIILGLQTVLFKYSRIAVNTQLETKLYNFFAKKKEENNIKSSFFTGPKSWLCGSGFFTEWRNER